MNCGICAAPLQDQQAYCSQCGTPIYWGNFHSPPLPPVLQTWKTSSGFSILGALAANALIALMGISILYNDNPVVKIAGLFLSIFMFIYLIFMVVYPVFIYPSFFKEKPFIRSPKLISFLNFFFGSLFVVVIPASILFPLLWNKNLTVGKKGVSSMVFSIIITASLIINIAWIATMIPVP